MLAEPIPPSAQLLAVMGLLSGLTFYYEALMRHCCQVLDQREDDAYDACCRSTFLTQSGPFLISKMLQDCGMSYLPAMPAFKPCQRPGMASTHLSALEP